MKKVSISEFWLKVAGLLFMTLDHIGVFLQGDPAFADGSLPDNVGFWLRCVGRLAMPLFLFMLAEGMHKTHDRGNYLMRLGLLWGVVFFVELGLYLIPSTRYLSMPQPFTDLILCALFVYLLERKEPWAKALSLLPLGWILLSYAASFAEGMEGYLVTWTEYVPPFVRSSYSLYALLGFLAFYYGPRLADYIHKKSALPEEGEEGNGATEAPQRLRNILSSLLFLIAVLLLWAVHRLAPIPDPLSMGLQTYGLLSLFLVIPYDGTRGYDKKWWRYFNYLYYPVHIAILALAFGLMIL